MPQIDPDDPRYEELPAIELGAVSKNGTTTVVDYSEGATSKPGREVVVVEIVNEHRHHLHVEAGTWSQKVSAGQTRRLRIPGGHEWVDIRASGGAIEAGNVYVTPTIEKAANEADRARAREARRLLGERVGRGRR